MKAIGYRRLSPGERKGDGTLGLEAQLAAIDTTARELGADVAVVFTDEKTSGGVDVDKRDGLTSALGALEEGDVLIVAKRDRIGRDPFVLALTDRLVAKRGARIVSGTPGETLGLDDEAPEAVLHRMIIDAFAVYERALVAARTKAALAMKKARGEVLGAVGLGEKRLEDGSRVVDEDELATVNRILELDREGFTRSAIAKRLEEEGRSTKRGGKWTHKQVGNVIRRMERQVA